jgi:membrane-associated phospholipid phosphatase
MDIPFFNAQIDWLYAIASIRNGWLDPIFLFLNYFDSVYFVLIIIPVVWIGVSSRWGLRVAIVLILSSLINFHLKELFQFPRPIVYDPHLAMIPLRDPGFPSGAAQMAALLGGLLVYGWKNRWSWVVAISYALVIGFSRLYLGVHYPMDVLGGYFFGLVILAIFIFSITPIENFCKKEGWSFCMIPIGVLCFLYAFLVPSPFGPRMMAGLFGICLGAYGSYLFRLNPTKPLPLQTRILSVAVTALIVYFLYFFTRNIPPPFQSFIIAIWISFAALPACRAIFSSTDKSKPRKSRK